MSRRLPPEALALLRSSAVRLADSSATAVAQAIQREGQRRRDEACLELAAMTNRVDRLRTDLRGLRKVRLLSRAVVGIKLLAAKRRRGAASDYCAALGVKP